MTLQLVPVLPQGGGMEQLTPPHEAVPWFIRSADDDSIAANGSAAAYVKMEDLRLPGRTPWV